MSCPITVNIISDDEKTPLQFQSKRQRSNFDPNPTTVFIIDDDPTPRKSSPSPSTTSNLSVVPETPSVVQETPMMESQKSYAPLIRCRHSVSDTQLNFSSSPDPKPSGLICLESDEEQEGLGSFPVKLNDLRSFIPEVEDDKLELPSPFSNSSMLQNNTFFPHMAELNPPQVSDHSGEDDNILYPTYEDVQPNCQTKTNADKKSIPDELAGRARSTKEEKARLMNEKKQQKEQEKLQKAALKAQAAEMKKQQKQIQSWEKGKFAQQSIIAKIDTKVVEQGSIGGQLLTRLAEKGITFQITSNPIERSIIWTMAPPANIAQALSRGTEIRYVLILFEAEEFCRLVADKSLMDHVSHVQSIFPSRTVCYLTNRLLAYINKREQNNYKNPGNHSGWKRPPVEQFLANLTTHFVGVHSRLCTDEAELAEHVVGLTCSLASCQFRKKLTRLSVNANGNLIPKDADRFLIKKSTWLKALIAIPKVQPRFAIAIWKKYPTMKSLLSVYMDPSKSEHEKEFLLENLTTEGLVGDNRRLGEICSKRVYRVLMAQSGTIKTDDVENGADFFNRQSRN